MARCKKCGSNMAPRAGHLCARCLHAWSINRKAAFEQAKTELGGLNAGNMNKIRERVKEIEGNIGDVTTTGEPSPPP